MPALLNRRQNYGKRGKQLSRSYKSLSQFHKTCILGVSQRKKNKAHRETVGFVLSMKWGIFYFFATLR